MTNLERVEKALEELLLVLHEEFGWFNEEELDNTPKRIAKFYKEWQDNQDFNFTVFENPGYDQLIILKDIDFQSMCSHHMIPFVGKVHIGYLPDKKICGISKLARTVRKFASKPQVQEQMTQELADFLFEKLEPKFVMVIVEATHFCMVMRGVRQPNAKMVTSAIRVKGLEDWVTLKNEMLRLVGLGGDR